MDEKHLKVVSHRGAFSKLPKHTFLNETAIAARSTYDVPLGR
jgi:hypothetical protein